MSEPEFTSDPWLDARLRNVPLPVGFLAKLQEIGTVETQKIDRALRNVPVPEGLLDRLHLIAEQPRSRWDFARWEWAREGIRSINLRNVNWQDMDWRRVGPQLAIAATLLVSVGVGMFALVGHGSKSPEQSMAQAPSDRTSSEQMAKTLNGTGPDRDSASSDRRDQVAQDKSNTDRESQEMPFDDFEFDVNNDPSSIAIEDLAPRPALEVGPGPAPEMPKAGSTSVARTQRGEQLPLGARVVPDELPDLDSVEVHVPRGLNPPRLAGYDLLFQLRNGLHPFVDPSLHKDLRSVQVPLVTSSAGYRRAWRWLKEGRLPAAGDLRTEEFLATVDYGQGLKPVTDGTLAIRTAGGPAPLRDEGLSLLQVAVQAGALPHEAHGPTHLTIVLDTSAGMRRPDRWAAVQTALGSLRGPMGPADHVTLIGYSDQPELLADSVGRDEAVQLLSALQTSQSRRTANLAAGLNLACSMLPHPAEAAAGSETAKPNDAAKPAEAAKPIEAAAPVERRILVISGGRIDSDGQSAERAGVRLAELAKSGVSLQLLDLSRGNTTGESKDGDKDNSIDALSALAAAADGRLTRVADPSTLSWNLIEALIGRSPVVAAQTSLRVTFNPNVVAAYRLIGHERTTITGPSRVQTEVDLRAGESAGGLFEVWLKPAAGVKGKDDNVATIEVNWQAPGYGKAQHLKQSVAHGQFAKSFTASVPSLQVAALAALAAETMRGSTFAPASRSLSHVIELSRQLSPTLQGQPSVRELTDFIQQAEKVRLHGAKLRRNAERKGS